ncbi:MAG: biotin--[acetyl-CoA-carboxylase] ligase [Flavobacteriaceae bacterium]|nr:biotin--[acetyl-CoA-carboxylase] ligase [Flavobacteriaceae bacterium]
MFLVKLNATNSTSTYLRQLVKNNDMNNWTVVTAEFQTLGRGQMQTKWISDKCKNLICSILIKFDDLKIEDQFYLNCAISLGIFNALQNYNLPQFKIKWPNDIMSASRKLGGILIENSLKNDKIYQTIVGIGLNINQDDFPSTLPKAISMKQILKQEFDRNKILIQIVNSIKLQVNLLNQGKFELLYQNYIKILFKKDQVQMFEDNRQQKFMGKIIGVSKQGLLCIMLENEQIKKYNFKEIKYLGVG